MSRNDGFGRLCVPAVVLAAGAAVPSRVEPVPAKPARTNRRPKPAVNELKERDIQSAILDLLEYLPGVFAERQNTGGAWLPGKGGEEQLVRFSRPGAPDIRCCVFGRYVALEVKRPGEVQNENQIAWQAEFEAAGGKYFVVTSPDEALAAIRSVIAEVSR